MQRLVKRLFLVHQNRKKFVCLYLIPIYVGNVCRRRDRLSTGKTRSHIREGADGLHLRADLRHSGRKANGNPSRGEGGLVGRYSLGIFGGINANPSSRVVASTSSRFLTRSSLSYLYFFFLIFFFFLSLSFFLFS